MRICVDAREFAANQTTGISRYLQNLLSLLSGQSGPDLTLLVRSADVLPAGLEHMGPRCISLPTLPTPVIDQILLPRITARQGAHVFFSPYYKVPLTGRFKRIITVHDIMFLRLPGLSRIGKLMCSTQLGLAARKADAILVDSEFTRTDLVSYLPYTADKLRVLHPGLEAAWLEQCDAAAIEQAHARYADGKPFFLYVGNFKPHKNVDLLVKTFAELDSAGAMQGRCLVLAGGDGKNSERIARLVTDLGRQNTIRIHERVPDSDLKALYASADWFVTASEYEGFGYPVAEAMACGCPVICHPCTSIPEVTGGHSIDIVSLDPEGVSGALQKALSLSESRRIDMVTQGRAHAATFTSKAAADAFLRVVESLTVSV